MTKYPASTTKINWQQFHEDNIFKLMALKNYQIANIGGFHRVISVFSNNYFLYPRSIIHGWKALVMLIQEPLSLEPYNAPTNVQNFDDMLGQCCALYLKVCLKQR